MRPTHRRLAATAAGLMLLPVALVGCGIGDEDEEKSAAKPARAPAEEAAARSRERVQAYLDAMAAKDVAAGRSQLCALLHDGFDLGATGPNGDFADHFQVPEAAITDIRSGPRAGGQRLGLGHRRQTHRRPAAGVHRHPGRQRLVHRRGSAGQVGHSVVAPAASGAASPPPMSCVEPGGLISHLPEPSPSPPGHPDRRRTLSVMRHEWHQLSHPAVGSPGLQTSRPTIDSAEDAALGLDRWRDAAPRADAAVAGPGRGRRRSARSSTPCRRSSRPTRSTSSGDRLAAGLRGQGVPAAGRRLRRDVRRQHREPPAGQRPHAAADGGRADLRRVAAGGQGRPGSPGSTPSPARRRLDALRPARRTAAT